MVKVAVIGPIGLCLSSIAYAQQVPPLCSDNSRACLARTASAYLDALVKHDASAVPFAPDVRRTEQGRVTGTNETEIRAHTRLQPDMSHRSNTRFFYDQATRNIVAFTLLHLPGTKADPSRKSLTDGRETGKPSTVHLAERFRIDQGLIKEIEAVFYIQQDTPSGTSGWPK